MGGVFVRGQNGCRAIIRLLFAGASGDLVVLDSGETAFVRCRQIRTQIIEIQVEADIAIKVAVPEVAWVTFVTAPDLFCGFNVASEGGDAVLRENGGENGIPGF